MQRDQLPRFRPAANYVLPRWKLVYVSNPKAACTSIKWILAALQGVNGDRFYKTIRYETTRATTIHRERQVWGATPRLRNLDDEQLAEITPENGWMVFTASRNPATRLWSGWQSKLLLREPMYYTRFGDEPWFPRIPRTTEDVLEDWFRFVDAVREDPEIKIMQDVHFRGQAKQLAIGTVPYDRIYDTSEFGELLEDLTKHVQKLGWEGELTVRRSNETPLPALASAFPDKVLDVVHDVYAADYDAFDYPRSMPRGVRTDDGYPKDLVGSVGILVERHERIGDLTRSAKALRRRARIAAKKAAAAPPPRKAPPPPPPPTLSQRVRRRIPFLK